VVLDVTPQIDEDGNIILHVHPSVSQVSTVNKGLNLGSLGNFTLPLAASSTSEMDSMVRGQNGQVVAIGGLMRQATTTDRSGVPAPAACRCWGAVRQQERSDPETRAGGADQADRGGVVVGLEPGPAGQQPPPEGTGSSRGKGRN
jgi:hypothetical protein